MSYEKVVAVYDTLAHADNAVNTLKGAGYSAGDVSVIRNEDDADRAGLSEPGLWHRLFGSDIHLHEAGAYGRSVSDGHAVVSVRVPESEAPKVIKLLESVKPIDVLEKSRTMTSSVKPAATVVVPPVTSGAAEWKEEEVVRLAEEQLDVRKRRVEGGVTRVRRFTVEKPVEASVSLHEEHTEIMRRAIADPSYVKDIDWSDKTIDVTEMVEEPVVNKTTRVAEEVVIRRSGSDHVETIHDTVRRQQLDVERAPGPTVKKSA